MKRKTLVALMLCTIGTTALGQVNYGIKGGVNLGKSSYSEAPFKDSYDSYHCFIISR